MALYSRHCKGGQIKEDVTGVACGMCGGSENATGLNLCLYGLLSSYILKCNMLYCRDRTGLCNVTCYISGTGLVCAMLHATFQGWNWSIQYNMLHFRDRIGPCNVTCYTSRTELVHASNMLHFKDRTGSLLQACFFQNPCYHLVIIHTVIKHRIQSD